jgi:hypothetical protein
MHRDQCLDQASDDGSMPAVLPSQSIQLQLMGIPAARRARHHEAWHAFDAG